MLHAYLCHVAHKCTSLFLIKYIAIFLLFFGVSGLHAQIITDSSSSQTAVIKSDTSEIPRVKKHSPKTATILSLVLPGAGQVYNRKNWWWKVPVIYGVGGALVYSAVFYQNGYDEYRAAYKERLEQGTNKDPLYNRYQTPTLQSIRDSYRDARDMSYVWLVVVYALQATDAAVEAHFFDFNMNENVSLNVQPQVYVAGPNSPGGLQLTLKF